MCCECIACGLKVRAKFQPLCRQYGMGGWSSQGVFLV